MKRIKSVMQNWAGSEPERKSLQRGRTSEGDQSLARARLREPERGERSWRLLQPGVAQPSFASRSQSAAVVVLALGLLNGCDALSDSKDFFAKLKRDWNALLTVMQGGRNPLPKVVAEPSPKSPRNDDQGFTSPRAIRAKMNAETLQEMFRVIFQRDPRNPAEFGNWVDTLNQGASFEGVYNGFTHSSVYRGFETENKGASPLALKVFGQELALIEQELPVRTEFTEESAKPLPVLGEMTPEPVRAEREARPSGPAPKGSPSAGVDLAVQADRYSKLFISASIFTLKRVLSDEAMKLIAAKRAESKPKLADWYGKWVVHMASYDVDFGLVLRNKRDEGFHSKWALSSSEDQLTWEVLNRIHRVLNAFNQKR